MTEEVLRLIKREKLIQENDCVIAGVSGGADSVCLLLLLCRLREELTYQLSVVHVEHGIRGQESREDAAFVKRLCERLQVPCRIFSVDAIDYAASQGLGLEEAARILRYQCFAEAVHTTGAKTKVALAHHGDDNAETMLFQMTRGSGIRGMGGMRLRRNFSENGEIIRPLLFCSRREVEAYLKATKEAYREDATNRELEYSRNRIRHKVIPELEKINERAVEHLGRSAVCLQEIMDYMDAQVDALMPKVCKTQKAGFLLTENLKEEAVALQRLLVHRVLSEAAGSQKDIASAHVEEILELMEHQVGRKIALPYQLEARRVYEGVLLQKRSGAENKKYGKEPLCVISKETLAGLEKGEELAVALPQGKLHLRIFSFDGEMNQLHKKKYTKWLNYDKIKNGLVIRTRVSGDYFVLDDEGHKKKLKDYFITEKIPSDERDQVILVAEESHILWMIGGRISADAKIDQNTQKILEIRIVGGKYHED